MAKIKRSYKITSFLNASFTINYKRETDRKQANTFEIVCFITTNEKFIPFSDFEEAIEKVTKSLSNKYLNDLPQFKSKFFSTEVLAEYLMTEINEGLKEIKSRLYRIEVSEDPIRTICLEVK